MCEAGAVEVLQTVCCSVQLSHILAEEAAEKVKSRTNSSLLTVFFLMYSTMFPWAIHSDTVTN